MLRKANQKRILDNVVIGEGDFTTEYFSRMDWRDMLGDKLVKELGVEAKGDVTPATALAPADLRQAFAAAEDEEDQEAAQLAEGEMVLDDTDFGDQGPDASVAVGATRIEGAQEDAVEEEEEDELGESLLGHLMASLRHSAAGTIDRWMLNWLEEDEDLLDEL